MYIINGIAYAREKQKNMKVTNIKILDDLIMIITFSTGEQRLFDATCMLQYPAFKALENEQIFKSANIEYGVVTWDNGNIDLAPETMYEKSYAYEPICV